VKAAASPPADAAPSWLAFWSRPNRIYVNERHLEAHYARIGNDLLRLIGRRAAPVVLDFGCGEALAAPRLAAACRRLLLYDAVADLRARVARRFEDDPRIAVLSPEAWRSLPPASVDVMVVNSVIQYLGADELDDLLQRTRRALSPAGEAIFADVIPPGVGPVDDALQLLAAARAHGFVGAALAGLLLTLFSDYRRLRRSVGLRAFAEAEFRRLLARHGLAAERLPANVGFHRKRMAFLARPA
jgi:SAM-dependent methyltransferase